VLVTGSNSRWSLGTNGLIVGDNSDNNSVTVTASAGLVSGFALIGTDLSGSNTPGSNNSVLVSSNGTWTNTGDLTVGESGSGTLTIASGGNVTATAVFLANSNNSIGTLNVGRLGMNEAAGTLTLTDSNNSIVFGSGSGSINFNQSNTASLSANISGAGSVNQLGSGTSILTGNNGYSGVTLITNGTLQVGNGSTNGTLGSGTVSNNASLVYNRSDYAVAGNIISGSGSLTQSGSGTTALTGDSSYIGRTIISSGALSIGYGGTNGSIGTNSVYVASAASLILNRSDVLSLFNDVSGSGSLVVLGGSTATLLGNNSYGSTFVNGTTLQVGTNSTNGTLGTGNVVLTNYATLLVNRSDTVTISNTIIGQGYLDVQGSGTSILTANNSYSKFTTNGTSATLQIGTNGTTGSLGSESVYNDGSLIFNRSDAVTVSNTIQGSGSLTQKGSGSLILTGNNSYFGVTAINSGALILNGTNAGSGGITVSSARFGGTGFATNSAVSMGSGTITPGNGPSYGTLSVGSLTMTGGTLNIFLGGGSTSLLSLNGASTLGGVLNFTTNSTLTASSYTFLTNSTGGFGGTTFASTTNLPTGYQVVYTTNSVYLQLISQLGPISTSFSGTNAVITGGSTNFIVTVTNSAPAGSGNLVFTGTNGINTTGSVGSTTVTPQSATSVSNVFAYNGTTVGSNQTGTVTISSTNSVPSNGTGTVTVNVYDHAAGSLTNSNISLYAHVGYTSALTANVGISNSNGYRVGLYTTNTTNGAITIAGVTNVAAGTSSNAILSIATGQGSGIYSNNISVVYGDSTNLVGAISGVSTSTLTASALIYSGQSTWTAGSGNWTNFTNWSATGGTPGLDGSLSTNDTATFGTGGGGTVTLNTNAALNTLTFSNSSAYNLAGSGTISLVQGSNTTSISTIQGSHTISNKLNLSTNVTVTNAASTILTLATNVGGSGAITKSGSGTLALIASNSYSGGTILNGGILAMSNNAAVGTGAITIASNSTIAALASLNVTNNIAIAGSSTGTFDVGSGLNLIHAGIVSGNVLAKNGAGTLTLSNYNSYSGGTLLNFGVIAVGATNALGTGSINVASGALLDFSIAGTGAITNTLLGSGTVVTTGVGTLTLGDNTTNFTGSIGADGAILRITNTNSIGLATNLFITNSGTIRFSEASASNSVTNTITVQSNSSGVIEHGTGTGTLTLAGTLVKNAATLTLRGTNTGFITITGGITGSAANSDLVYDSGNFNVNTSNSYNGPTYLINGAFVNANADYAIPTANGRSAVYLDQTNTGANWGSGSSTLSLGTNQTVASLSGIASSRVNLGNSTLTIGTVSGNTTFAGTIYGVGGSLLKDGSSTVKLSGANIYSGGTTISSGAIIAGNTSALGTGSLTLNGTGRLILDSMLTFGSFNWSSPNAYIGFTSLANGYYLNATNDVTLSGATNYFDLTGLSSQLSATPTLLFAFGTNALTASEFGIVGDQSASYYALTVSGNRLYVALATLLIPANETINFSKTNTYPSVTFVGPNSTLNVTPVGNLTISTNVTVSNSSTLNVDGILTVSNTVAVNTGSILSGIGTINANVVNSGYLTPVSLNSGLPGTMIVNGSVTLNPSGTLGIGIASSSQYSKLAVTGPIQLGGTLSIIPMGGYQLTFGQQFNIITASSITGAFSSIIAPAGYRGRLLLENNNTFGALLIAPASYTQVAQSQNQINVARALDTFISATSGDKLKVSTALDHLTTAQEYQMAFDEIGPRQYLTLSTIAFNLANAQNMELLQRLWSQRVAGSGFSMNGFADNTPIWEGQGDGKDSSKDILRPGPDNRWGMFADANGIFAQANSGNMLPNYKAQSGGVTIGVSYRVNPKLSVGVYTGYEGTYAKYNSGSKLIDNSVRFGLFGTYGHQDGKGLFVDGLVGGGYNNYQVSRNISFPGINRTAKSSPGAGEFDSMVALGYDIKKGNFTYGPVASLQYTYFAATPFSETGAQSLNLSNSGWNTSSMLSSIGAHAAYNWQVNNSILVVPQINLSWQHEFMQNPYAINSSLGGANFSYLSSAPIRDFLYTGVGFTVVFANNWNTSFFYNASVGNSDLSSQNIFWSLGFKF
jgi:autotransporter-associated beta strand protein